MSILCLIILYGFVCFVVKWWNKTNDFRWLRLILNFEYEMFNVVRLGLIHFLIGTKTRQFIKPNEWTKYIVIMFNWHLAWFRYCVTIRFVSLVIYNIRLIFWWWFGEFSWIFFIISWGFQVSEIYRFDFHASNG